MFSAALIRLVLTVGGGIIFHLVKLIILYILWLYTKVHGSGQKVCGGWVVVVGAETYFSVQLWTN